MPLARNERYLINPGWVGEPRDGDWRAAFALYEHDGDGPRDGDVLPRSLRCRRNPRERILSANLPERLAARLRMGR